jgi:hypothetical protein
LFLEDQQMAFNTEQLAYAGKAAIDYFLKNEPVDQINTARPLIKKLVAGKREYAGGLQYVVEQLRKSNDSNFQAYFGDSQVTYNRKRTLEQAKFSWGAFHDGFGLNEDELAQNGISFTDDRNAVPSDAEKVQLTNLLKENSETLRLGMQEGMDLMLHRDGTQDPLEIAGLDALVALDPTAGTIGGIQASGNTWWQNYANLNVADTALEMEKAWRECIRAGGNAPDFILAGARFIDAYRADATEVIVRNANVGGSRGNRNASTLDAGVGDGVNTGLYFKGVEIIWDPVFDVLDDLEPAATAAWADRCYFLNTRRLSLRPIKGHWMVSRRPPRVYDRYVHYWALTAKAALTTSQRNAHAVLALAGTA